MLRKLQVITDAERSGHFQTERRYCGTGSATRVISCVNPALSPARAGSHDADVLRASQLQHAVQHADGDGHLARLLPIRLRTESIADDALPARNIGL